MRRLLIILFATSFVFLAAAELPPLLGSSSGVAEARRRCPRGYRKVCGRSRNCRKRYVRCRRYRRGRCVSKVYRRTCVRSCRCVRRR